MCRGGSSSVPAAVSGAAAGTTAPPPSTTSSNVVLLTGGCGFIGSHTADALASRGDTVIIVDELNDYYDVTVKHANKAMLLEKHGPERCRFFHFDICDKARMRGLFETFRPNLVCHLAARAGVRPSIADPYIYIHSNVEGTVVLLDLARQFGVGNFVYASSSSVYGGSKNEEFFETDSVDNPVSPYAATKKTCELMAHTWHHLYKLNVTGLRFFTVYGPRGRPDMAPLKFIKRVSGGITIDRYGDGSSERDYTYIADIVDGVVRALDRPLGCEVFNLANGSPISLTKFIGEVERAVGRKAVINPMPEQPGDVPRTCGNVDKARRLLGYDPKTPVRVGLQKTAEWYLSTTTAAAAKKKTKTAATATLTTTLAIDDGPTMDTEPKIAASPVTVITTTEDLTTTTAAMAAMAAEGGEKGGGGLSSSSSFDSLSSLDDLAETTDSSASSSSSEEKDDCSDSDPEDLRRAREEKIAMETAFQKQQHRRHTRRSRHHNKKTNSKAATMRLKQQQQQQRQQLTPPPPQKKKKVLPPDVLVATRIYRPDDHHGHKTTGQTEQQQEGQDILALRRFLVASMRTAHHVAVAVKASGPRGPGLLLEVERLVASLLQPQPLLATTTTRGFALPTITVVPLLRWGGFTPALNALLDHAAMMAGHHPGHHGIRHILFQSVEVSVADPRVLARLRAEMTPTTLVAGAAFPGAHHTSTLGAGVDVFGGVHSSSGDGYSSSSSSSSYRTSELTGRSVPWNTLALWNVERLRLTGFAAVSEGRPSRSPPPSTTTTPTATTTTTTTTAREGAGVEEVAVVALHQNLWPDRSEAKLLWFVQGDDVGEGEEKEMPGTAMGMGGAASFAEAALGWHTDWDSPERLSWHLRKMESKEARGDAQLTSLGLPASGIVHHVRARLTPLPTTKTTTTKTTTTDALHVAALSA